MASWFHGADEYALKLVRAKARKYLGRYGLTAADVEDMQQELLLHLHFAMKKYDPSRGERTTFMDRVVQKRILSIIRYKTASPRDYRKEAHSLNEPAPGRTCTAVAMLMYNEAWFRREHGYRWPWVGCLFSSV